MTKDERRYWHQLASTIDEHYLDTLPKQEALLDYVQARAELIELKKGYQTSLKHASNNPDDHKSLTRLTKWSQMICKIETKINVLRTSIGLNAKYESQLNKAKQIKGGPKGGVEIKPWDSV